jgi:lysophospholipase L1-like esterase
MMKTILCYGDSNTWGFKPLKEEPELKDARFSRDQRWTGRLAELLGKDYRVEEDGLNGRTTCFDDPLDPIRNGLAHLECSINVKIPVDLIVFMLGTNDTKDRFACSPYCIAKGLERLIMATRGGQYGPAGKDPAILVVAPPPLRDTMPKTWLSGEFSKESVKTSKGLAKEYQKIAEKNGCAFLDAGSFAQISKVDATHLDEANHAKFAEAVYKKIKEMKV